MSNIKNNVNVQDLLSKVGTLNNKESKVDMGAFSQLLNFNKNMDISKMGSKKDLSDVINNLRNNKQAIKDLIDKF